MASPLAETSPSMLLGRLTPVCALDKTATVLPQTPSWVAVQYPTEPEGSGSVPETAGTSESFFLLFHPTMSTTRLKTAG